jgi:hypothetical protein
MLGHASFSPTQSDRQSREYYADAYHHETGKDTMQTRLTRGFDPRRSS